MKNRTYYIFAAVLMVCMAATSGFASDHHKQPAKKVGILLVAFGSSEASAQASFDNIERKVKKAYDGIPVRWAYTSHIIRQKLAGQGKHLDSPQAALAAMQDEGFTHVAVQSLHTIPGQEYHDLETIVAGFKTMGAFQQILVGRPLLSSQQDMADSVAAVLASLPKERKKGGHRRFNGTRHPPFGQCFLRRPHVPTPVDGPRHLCGHGGRISRY